MFRQFLNSLLLIATVIAIIVVVVVTTAVLVVADDPLAAGLLVLKTSDGLDDCVEANVFIEAEVAGVLLVVFP